MIKVVLVHAGEFVLPELGEGLGRYASRKLAERGVQLCAKTKLSVVTAREVPLSDGTSIASFTLVWTAGTSPHPLLNELDVPKEHGRVKVNAHMEVEGFSGLWALGDCAMVPDSTGGFCPPTAQHASREGKVLTSNIIASRCALSGSEPSVCSPQSVNAQEWRASLVSTFRLRCLVALADSVSQQTAANRKETAGRTRLDA